MLTMKTKNFKKSLFAVFAIFAVFAVLGVVSAAPICTGTLCMNLVNSPTSASHNSDVTVKFSVTYEGTATTPPTLTFSGTANGATWKTLPSSTTINIGETKELVAVLNIPKGSSGTASAVLKVDASSGSSAELTIPIITIQDSAELKLDKTRELTKTQSGVVKVTNDGNAALDLAISETSSLNAGLSKQTINNFTPGSSETFEVSLGSDSKLKFGNNVVNIKVEDASKSLSKTTSFTIKNGFCKAGEVGGNLEISKVKIDNKGQGKDDEWKLLDTIEVEVRVDNDGNDDVKDVFVVLGLFDSNGNDQVTDLEFDNSDEEEIDLGRINDGKDETVTFTFKVPADFDDGSYRLAVKAYSDDLKEEAECVDSSSDLSDDIFDDISVERESDEGKFIAFDNIVISPSQASCGERVSLTTDVFNIGDDDQDQVRVNLFSQELGLSQSVEIRNDLDQGDDDTVNFDFMIPQSLQNKGYVLSLSADYDYRSGTYRQSSDDEMDVILDVIGCGSSPGTSTGGRIASIAAVLDSDALAGEELVVRATITSLKTERATFAVNAYGFNSWARVRSISDTVIDLEPGQSREVTFRFDVDSDAEGTQSFDIEASSGGDVESREVEVNIGSGSGAGITGSAIFGGEGNALIWVIGIINVILIVLIIVVAVRISRR